MKKSTIMDMNPADHPIDQEKFGVFETMLFINGRINLEEYHFERLFDAIEKLRMKRPEKFTVENIRHEITELCKKNKCYRKARVKLSVFQNENHETVSFDYFIEALSLNDGNSDAGLKIDIFPGAKKKCNDLANLKTINRGLYEAAEIFAKENNWDDCLILNEHGRICESTISNVFWIKDEIIYTPPLSEGCVAGVMRRFLMEKMRDAGYRIREKSLVIEELVEADEVFLTNAIRGIRWVKQFRKKVYRNNVTEKLKNDLFNKMQLKK